MKLHLTLLLLLITTSLSAHAGCDTGAIKYMRSSGFGLSFGSAGFSLFGSDEKTINVPVSIGNQRGCWKQKTKLSYEVESKDSGKFRGKMIINLPQSDVENIPNFHVETYLAFDDTNLQNLRTLRDIKMDFVHYTCSGDNILSVESFSGNFAELSEQSNGLEVSASFTFASGQAAENLKKYIDSNSRANFLPDALAKTFIDRVGPDNLPMLEENIINRPLIYVSSTLVTNSASTNSTYTTEIANGYGCTKLFKEAMSEFHTDTIEDSMEENLLKIDANRKRIKIKWNVE